jgi:diguanylate cyclase
METALNQLEQELRNLDACLRDAMLTQGIDIVSVLEAEAPVRDGERDNALLAQSLDGLRRSVQRRIDALRRYMELCRCGEPEVEKLTARIRALEAEKEALREQVEQVRNQALIDPLTGIANRLAYDSVVEQEYARWQRYRAPLALLILDLDYFKRINDGYGHQAGDEVLKGTSSLLVAHIRASDFIARYGGEEFVILMPQTTREQAFGVAEKIRLAVQDRTFCYHAKTLRITLSCGIAEFRQNDTPKQVFARADVALYHAKAAGRNGCRTA